jgi:uncharacterized membrane protein
VELERIAPESTQRQVIESIELTRFTSTIPPGETQRERVTIEPTMTGDDLRLSFLLYHSNVPEEPTQESAYRNLHLWISVADP